MDRVLVSGWCGSLAWLARTVHYVLRGPLGTVTTSYRFLAGALSRNTLGEQELGAVEWREAKSCRFVASAPVRRAGELGRGDPAGET